MDELERIGWEEIGRHEAALSARLHDGLRAIDGVHVLGPTATGADTLSVAAFTVEGMHHGLVAARLSAEFGIGVRHGCFCAHPYLLRLLGVGPAGVADGPRRRAAGRPQRHPRCRAGQLRAGDVGRRCRRPAGRPARRWPAAIRRPCPTSRTQVTGDFWPGRAGLGMERRRSPGRSGLRPWVSACRSQLAGPIVLAARPRSCVLASASFWRRASRRPARPSRPGRHRPATWHGWPPRRRSPSPAAPSRRSTWLRTPPSPRSTSAASPPRPACPPPWPSPRATRTCWWSPGATTSSTRSIRRRTAWCAR